MTILDGEEGIDDTKYADALSNFEDSSVVIFGVPFDKTSSHRAGSANAPGAIRKESYNYETFLNRYDFNIESVKIHDLGDSKDYASVDELITDLPNSVTNVIEKGKFLITLGGEHSVTLPIVKTHQLLHPDDKLGVIYLDAHLDFRDSYLDNRYSHACVARRLTEIIGMENIVELGIRSYSAEESEMAAKQNLRIYTADNINEMGMIEVVRDSLKFLNTKKIYLTLDMDVFDPSYAPGVGNPEYFGLSPWQIRECIEIIGRYLVGADIVEVSPPYDNGNAAALAAQLIQIIISQIKN